MTAYQKAMLFVFGTLTIALIIMEAFGIRGNVLSFSRYIIMLALVLVVYVARGKSTEQRILFWTFPLMIIGDFFLVFSYIIKGFPERIRYLGFIPFTAAYTIMIIVYIKGFKPSKKHILPLVFYIGLIIALNNVLKPHVGGIDMLAGSVLIAAVTIMAWAGSTAIWNGYYNKRTAKLMAFSGFLMVLCDYGVAFDLFYPRMFLIREALIVNVVWLTYIPGWLILAYIVIDKNLKYLKV